MAKQQEQAEQPAPVHYRTSKILAGVKGKVTGRSYTCTRGTLLSAPEGEFDGIDHVKPEPQK